MTTKKLIQSALLGAMLLIVQVVLAPLPNIELVTLLLLCYTVVFGVQRASAALAVFIALEGMIYGFGFWWINYLYVWPIWVFVVFLMRKNTSVLLWAVAAGAFGFSFGALCAVLYLLIGGPGAMLSYWVAGIPFDITHCIGNFFSVLLLYKPVVSVLKRQVS